MRQDHFLGIDGGGTRTTAWLATRAEGGGFTVAGRGVAGPANLHAVGFAGAVESLNQAIAGAFDDAKCEPGPVGGACLAMAGAGREDEQRQFRQWADQRQLAARFRVVHDALAVLTAGTPDGCGLAVISGTGSLVYGQNAAGQSARAGGWGYLLGDEGSGYALALAGLRAVAKAADGRGPATQLERRLLDRLGLGVPADLIAAVYSPSMDRARIASLADVVTSTAALHDPVARSIVAEASANLAELVEACAKKLSLAAENPFPLALAGGAILGSPLLREGLLEGLTHRGLTADPVQCVPQPVAGAVKLAMT
jgi:N-acetylmuramic acid 6-phosphate etherase